MGLDTTFDCWHGSYSSFMEWRKALAKAAGWPPLEEMLGFKGRRSWRPYEDDVLTVLLNHPDDKGKIYWRHIEKLAERLKGLVSRLPEPWLRKATVDFARGLRKAHRARQFVEFH